MRVIFTVQEVAEQLKVSCRTIERLVAMNQLRAIHVGRRLRVTEEALQAYISQEEDQQKTSGERTSP